MGNIKEGYKITTSVYNKEINCQLVPFSFFKSKHYVVFRIKNLKVYRIYIDQTLSSTDMDQILYTAFLDKLSEEMFQESQTNPILSDVYNRLPVIEQYMNSNDSTLIGIGVDLIKSFIQQIKKELGYADED